MSQESKTDVETDSRPLFLGRYDVDKTPALHFSTTTAVLGATDYDNDDIKPRRALKAMRDPSAVLAVVDVRAGEKKILRMLEAIQLLLSIDDAPVITFLAIDPRARPALKPSRGPVDASTLAGIVVSYAKNSYDITVHDIVGPDFTVRPGDDPSSKDPGKDKDFFSLLQYSFNLTPALREEISKDLSAMLTEREPHLKVQEKALRPSLRHSSIERKASFVLKPPLQPRPNSGPIPRPPPAPESSSPQA